MSGAGSGEDKYDGGPPPWGQIRVFRKTARVVGALLLLVGLVGTGWTIVLVHTTIGRVFVLALTSITAGVAALSYGGLAHQLQRNSEQYRFGYDLGHEAGFREGRRVAKPVVLNFATDGEDAEELHISRESEEIRVRLPRPPGNGE